MRSRVSRRSKRFHRCTDFILERLEGRVLLSTYTVMNLNDSGPGSLRQAILETNINLVDCAVIHGRVMSNENGVVIRGCTISDSGAINAQGSLDASDSTFSNTEIEVPQGPFSASLTNCTITGNQGDGIYNSGGVMTLTRCTV